MGNDVGVNSRSVVTKGSGGRVISGPDVCKTPSPGGPVPIPYPNVSVSSDLAKGSKSVQINGQPVCLKGSNFSKSSGDEAGSLGGIVSGKVGGQADPLSYSFDVQIEGRNVVRQLDVFQSNARNTPPAPLMQAPVLMAPVGDESAEDEELCPYCSEPVHSFSETRGNHVGVGQTLRRNIIADITDHPWYTGPWSLEAHHIICSEAMDDDEWPGIAWEFGYDINHKNNGVILPHILALACQLHVPLHRGSHSKGLADGLAYPDRIKSELEQILEEARSGQFCSNPEGLIKKLDNFSRIALKKISKFQWTITADGADYKEGKKGCSGAKTLPKKPDHPCPKQRNHGLNSLSGKPILKVSGPLEIGK